MNRATLDSDLEWMSKALELAERGRGYVEPNPLVGAIIVRESQIVGMGWHEVFGGPHAEANALRLAGDQAKDAELFVTLEPCSHHGKTPPCTDAILRAGIRRVVVAMRDPNPKVSGHGCDILHEAGLIVQTGMGEAEARRVNAAYVKLITTGRPYVHLKWAMTLDGKIASTTRNSQWITNEKARQRAHQLRSRMDGVLVGISTAIHDDPLLTARPCGPRTAMRIVLDTRARLPLTARLVQTARDVPTLVVVGRTARREHVERLRQSGCDVLEANEAFGRVSLTDLMSELGRREMTNLLVEGGAEVLGAFLDLGIVDEVHCFIAPSLLGGKDALSPFTGAGKSAVSQAMQLSLAEVEQLDGNLLVRAWACLPDQGPDT